MKHILSTIIALFIILTSSVSWSEYITMDDLVERNDLYYKKFTNAPFTGEISGKQNGGFKKGKRTGEWLYYNKYGQLCSVKNYKDGMLDGLSELYHENGHLMIIGNYEDGKKDGLWQEYYDNRQLKDKINFKDAKKGWSLGVVSIQWTVVC